jgi:hypothetical protein
MKKLNRLSDSELNVIRDGNDYIIASKCDDECRTLYKIKDVKALYDLECLLNKGAIVIVSLDKDNMYHLRIINGLGRKEVDIKASVIEKFSNGVYCYTDGEDKYFYDAYNRKSVNLGCKINTFCHNNWLESLDILNINYYYPEQRDKKYLEVDMEIADDNIYGAMSLEKESALMMYPFVYSKNDNKTYYLRSNMEPIDIDLFSNLFVNTDLAKRLIDSGKTMEEEQKRVRKKIRKIIDSE